MRNSILSRRCWAPLALVAATLVFVSGADAFWSSHGSYGSYGGGSFGSRGSVGGYASNGSYGSTGGLVSTARYRSVSYGSTGSYASTGSYGSYGSRPRWCPVRNLVTRIRANRAARIASRSSHGSYGGYVVAYRGSSHGSYGGYSTGSHGSAGSHGSTGGSVIYSEPTCYEEGTIIHEGPVEAAPTPAEPVPADTSADATLNVVVPAGAKVYVNGHATTSTGTRRSYISKDLLVGGQYAYDLRVEYEQDGRQRVEERTTLLRGGADVELVFGAEQVADSAEQVETKLTLNVPADARVTLAGAPTTQSGTDRTYQTQRLSAGEEWAGYTVRVEHEGQVQEQTITLRGGEAQHLDFFASTQLASL